ncbi:MAG: acyl-CoA/acyl-ACP dehydrogenase [Acetobacteraceae bacterium]|nr:acyl-CoA/acyl-ACP dehydrogenase [Acetobacteraceae bacterium]MBV8520592.1 acyl-CoA/acyl-ACP dehydrogenase [Acetobacteraceae bacterium]
MPATLTRNPDLQPYLDDVQFEFRDSVHGVLTRHASLDYIRECDEKKRFPYELMRVAAEQGWFAVTLPEQYGGIGDYLDMVAMVEIMAYHSIALARYWNMNVNMVGGALARFASEEIKQEMLPALAEGRTFFAFALSENNAGSDAASLTTKAECKNGDFVINGTKMWITGAQEAEYILTACRTERAQDKRDGISLILVPAKTPGVAISPIDLLGGHAVRTCEVNYVDVKVPQNFLVGELHRGWRQLTTVLAKERISLGAMCAGAAQAACDYARDYARERRQFGRPIASFQAIAHKLVDMQTLVDASRLLVFRAARLLQQGATCAIESSQAKFFASDTYVRVATEGLQIMGANGYSMEYPMQRHYREAKLFQIFGGTNEIQRNIAARELAG